MRNKFILATIITFLILYSSSMIVAQSSINEQRLDETIKKYMKIYRIPGAALSVSKDNEIVYAKGFGKTPEGNKVTADTPMYIGSVTKSFTALSVMQLAEQGKVDLDSPVIKYLPWFKVGDLEVGNNITIRNLLNHTSGLTDINYVARFSSDTTVNTSIEHISTAKPVAKPGSKYYYFNQNYQILGLIIEEVSGLSYGEYVKKHILQPLSMESTYLDKEEIEKRITHGHSAFFTFPIKMKEPFKAYSLPDGSIVSTANDMGSFLRAHNNTALGSNLSLLSTEGFKQMHTPNTAIGSNYGMGWEITKSKKGYTVIHHGGDLDSYHAYVLMIPEKGINIVLLINQNNYLYTTSVYNSLVRALINNTLGNNHEESMPLLNIYLIMTGVVVLAIIIHAVFSIIEISKWKSNSKLQKNKCMYLSIMRDLLVPIILLIIMPYLVYLYIERGVDLIEAFRMLPDLVLSIFLISILYIIKIIAKVVIIIKHSKIEQWDTKLKFK